MPMLAALPVPTRRDVLSSALCAAELNEPFDLDHTPSVVWTELFGSVEILRALVPCATLRLIGRLASDERDEIRVGAARALGSFVGADPERVESLLLPLACDSSRRVRTAAAETLGKLLAALDDADELINRWLWHPDRAAEVMARARRCLHGVQAP